jgi:hypothetical protein
VGGMGAGGTGGGGAVSRVACSPSTPGGWGVRPAHALGSVERVRLGVMGVAGGVALVALGLSQRRGHMMKSHRMVHRASG